MAIKTKTLPQKRENQNGKSVIQNPSQAVVGLPKIESEDRIMPRLLLMQGLSKFVQDQKAKAGDFLNSITAEVVTNTIFVPVAMTKNYIGLRYEGTKAVIEFRTDDKFDDRLKDRIFFSDRKSGVKATALSVLNCIGLFSGKLMLLSFSKSSYGAGKKLLNILTDAGVPVYTNRYRAISVKESNDSGIFYVWDIVRVEPAIEEEKEAAKMFQESFLSLAAKEVVVSDEVPF